MANNSFKVDKGLSLRPQNSSPINPISGDVYYDQSSDTYSLRQDDKWFNLSSKVNVSSSSVLNSANLTPEVVKNNLIVIVGAIASNIHGMNPSTEGRVVHVFNKSSQPLNIKHQSSTEATVNCRIITLSGNDIVVASGQCVALVYDKNESRWSCVSNPVIVNAILPMIGNSLGETLESTLSKADAELAKLFEDRNALLTDGGLITWTGSQVEFTENLKLSLNSKVAGGLPTIINLGSSTRVIPNNESWYVVINRNSGTVVSSIVSSTLPAVTSADQEVFLIAKHVNADDGTERLYWRNGMALNAGQTVRLGASGSGDGSGLGDDLITTQFRASFTDEFNEGPTAALSAVNLTLTKAAYNAARSLYQISYDATKTASVNSVNVALSSPASFTVQVGDVLIRNNEVRRIVVASDPSLFQIESPFSSNFASQPVTISQAVHSKDIYNLSLDGSPISAAFTESFSQILLDYEDTTAVGDFIFDINTEPVIGYSASTNNSSWSNIATRPTSPSTEISVLTLPTAGTSLYTRFFANKTSGSGTVNLLKYKAYVQKLAMESDGGAIRSAYAFTDGIGTPINCSLSVVDNKTRITLDWQYPVDVNNGEAHGSLDVYLNGQLIPRYIDSTLTPDAYYKEISSGVLELDSNYSSINVSVEILKRVATIGVDSSSENANAIASINNKLSINPTFQRFTSGSGTYITPANVKYIRIRMVGGGGGGQASIVSPTAWGSFGSPGTISSFIGGSVYLVAGNGSFGYINGGGGGTNTVSGVNLIISVAGAVGNAGTYKALEDDMPSGAGGNSFYGGGGGAVIGYSNGNNAAVSSGSGGSGGGLFEAWDGRCGAGGGAGGYIEAIIFSPAASYTYSVGAGGSGGLAASSLTGTNGGAGASGQIVIEEYYV
jgi:hypothetical protein